MNIFVLNENAKIAAQQHCDKHVVKMIIESAQMLSTAHRILDGKPERRPSKSGKTMQFHYVLPDDYREKHLYKSVHAKHPCTLWTMESSTNYEWHWKLFNHLCDEYTHRYGRVHETDHKLRHQLMFLPDNISHGPMTPFRQAIFDDCKGPDPVKAYRKYYHAKTFKMVWTKREVPDWYSYK